MKTMTAYEIQEPHFGYFDCYYRNEWLNQHVVGNSFNLISVENLHTFAYNSGFTHIKISYNNGKVTKIKVKNPVEGAV